MKVKAALLGVAAGFSALFPLAALAADAHIGGDFFLKGGEKAAHDLYAVGSSVTFVGPIEGDAVAAAENIWSESAVSQDVLFFGRFVTLKGTVDDDARIAGGQVNVSAHVGDDAVLLGAKVNLEPGAEVGNNLYIVAGAATLRGTVERDARVIARSARISGRVGGTLEVWGDAALEDGATVGGDFIYHARREIAIPSGAFVRGRVIFQDTSSGGAAGRISAALSGLFSLELLMMLGLGFLLFFFSRPRLEETLMDAVTNFWPRVLRGALLFLLLPTAAALLLASVVGAPAGILLLLLFATALLVSGALSGILVGAALERVFFKRSLVPLSYRPVLLGILCLSLVAVIPYLGLLIYLVLLLASLGAVGSVFYRKLNAL